MDEKKRMPVATTKTHQGIKLSVKINITNCSVLELLPPHTKTKDRALGKLFLVDCVLNTTTHVW